MKFAFITPRYGAELSDGPEHACRLLAEQVAHRHEVEVLTTCARDAASWKNEYAEGADRVRGVMVRRFSVSQLRDETTLLNATARLTAGAHDRQDELEWVRLLGPSAPGLIEHLKRQQRSYDALVFFSLQHATTVQGLAVAPERSVVFPCLEADPTLRFSLWGDLLRSARAVGLMSGAERSLLQAYTGISPQHEELVGVGIEAAAPLTYPRHQQDPADTLPPDDDLAVPEGIEEPDYLSGRGVPFRRRHRLYGSLVLYGGRLEPDNGTEEMLEYFHPFAAGTPDATLVLMGVKMIPVPDVPYVRLAGVLPDRDRMAAFEAADVTIAPTSRDLLVEPLLESLAMGTPVLASARNAAAVDHCRRANAGLYYGNAEEFSEALTLLLSDRALRERLGENGQAYVRQHFRWDAVLGRFDRLVSRVKRA